MEAGAFDKFWKKQFRSLGYDAAPSAPYTCPPPSPTRPQATKDSKKARHSEAAAPALESAQSPTQPPEPEAKCAPSLDTSAAVHRQAQQRRDREEAPHRDKNKGLRTAVFWKRAAFELLKVGVGEGGGGEAGAISCLLRFREMPGSDVALHVVTCTSAGSSETAEFAWTSSALMLRELSSLRMKRILTVVAGDFQFSRGSKGYEELCRDFRDAYQGLPDVDKVATAFGPGHQPDIRDFIFYPRDTTITVQDILEMPHRKALSAAQIHLPGSIFGSAHLSLAARFSFPTILVASKSDVE